MHSYSTSPFGFTKNSTKAHFSDHSLRKLFRIFYDIPFLLFRLDNLLSLPPPSPTPSPPWLSSIFLYITATPSPTPPGIPLPLAQLPPEPPLRLRLPNSPPLKGTLTPSHGQGADDCRRERTKAASSLISSHLFLPRGSSAATMAGHGERGTDREALQIKTGR